MFQGSIPALITPFRNGIVDERAFQDLIEKQIAGGSKALIPCGTTGEGSTLSHEEHIRVVQLCIEAAAKRVPVIAGAGSNATSEAIHLGQAAKAAGAEAMLSVVPYYNKPNQEGMYQHFKAIHDAVDLPMVLYNVPGRTIVDLGVETVGRLAQLPRVVGIKDATGDMSRVTRHRTSCGADFALLSGDDGSALGFNANGGNGCVSVTANVAPKQFADMQNASLRGDYATARAIDAKLASLHRALFLEPSPGGAKYACSLLGICSDEVRLPILVPSEPIKAAIRAAMIEAGLL